MGMNPLDVNDRISSTFVDPTGRIIDVRDDGDTNIYLVHDTDNWDGSKDGLAVIGRTPQPATLQGHVGQRLNSESVVNFLFSQSDFSDDMVSWPALANLDLVAELMMNRDLKHRILIEMQNLTKEQLRTLLNILQRNELLAAKESHRWTEKRIAGQRILLSLILTMQGKLAGIELGDPTGISSDLVIPHSRYGENDNRYKQNRDSILKLYNELLKQLND